MRLNRFLAAAGIGSRRQCDELIAAGRVTINGRVCTNFSAQPSERDHVKVDGKLVHPERGMTIARKRSLPVVVDPKFKNFFAYRGATVFKPNRRELELAMGAALDLAHPDAIPDALSKLAVDNLLLTLGGEGMMLVTKDQEITRIPTMAREVFDRA